MDQEPPLEVVLSSQAREDLLEIWTYNAEQHGLDHADEYIGFLLEELTNVMDGQRLIKSVELAPDLSYVTLRKRTTGHGHVAVFEKDSHNRRIVVLHIFHTAQDWPRQL